MECREAKGRGGVPAPVQQVVVATAARGVRKGNSSRARHSPVHVENQPRGAFVFRRNGISILSSGRKPGRSAKPPQPPWFQRGAEGCAEPGQGGACRSSVTEP